MNGRTLLAVFIGAAIAAGAASGQDKPKLYRWVDKQGKVHYDDALPPEAVNQARTEFSRSSGSTTGKVDRALTDEERAAQAAAAAAEAVTAQQAEELKRQEDVLMQTYNNEAELRRAYDERIGLLKTSLDSTDVSIHSLRDNLAAMLAQASETELDGRKVPDDRAKAIRELHLENLRQQQFQSNRRLELEALNNEYARVLQRFRELHAAAAAPAPATAATPAPAPPPGG